MVLSILGTINNGTDLDNTASVTEEREWYEYVNFNIYIYIYIL